MFSCQYLHCYNSYRSGSSLSFFEIPSDSRRDLWIKHSGVADLANKKGKIKFCEVHFYEKDILIKGDKKILKNKAVLKSVHESCDCTETITDVRCEAIVRKSQIQKSLNILNDQLLRKRKSNDGNFRIKKMDDDNLVFEYCCAGDIIDTSNNRSEWMFNGPPAKKIKIDDKEDFKEKFLKKESDALNTFIMTQIFHKKKSHFLKDEKELFLKYYYKSPSLYRQMLEDGFKLPSLSTIFRWHGSFSLTPGFNEKTLNMLKEKCSLMDDGDKKCTLLFDEMAIKRELDLRTTDDSVYGYVDFGEFGKKNIIANKALVLMIRGVKKNWKQSICYYIGNANGEELRLIILNAIKQLKEVGFDVSFLFLSFNYFFTPF